jgi:hypothetical protein
LQDCCRKIATAAPAATTTAAATAAAIATATQSPTLMTKAIPKTITTKKKLKIVNCVQTAMRITNYKKNNVAIF